ncbi:hypothetical protein ACFQGT_07865 [Natrialbaceae archaeon GCM10025810]|uniref:hypothetical protein n=1 Tax=Halovalidus salilacus TaxID=3075124 RepID=UPI00360803B8
MTTAFDNLQEAPQTQVDASDLNLEERTLLRRIKIDQTSTVRNAHGRGNFTVVYYLEGDEYRAAECFVEENRDHLEAIDFSKRNVLQSSVNHVVYDWILHHLGERRLEKYPTVVLEERTDGTRWIIDRDHYENYPNRRYTTGHGTAARLDDYALSELYADQEDVMTKSDLEAIDAIYGDVRYILEYFRVAEEYACDPITADNEMAIEKRD